ncbi:MAG: gliding motility lipoprotein GldH [Rikenellaceae bacterium]|jgi:hypothetical protein|nr:gliding motility lipoprotein GldH [Rikenellaceae bacterium]
MKHLTVSALALILVSCGSTSGMMFFAGGIDPRGWEPGDSISAVWHNTDTTTLYELSLAVNLAVFNTPPDPAEFGVTVATITPDTLTISETVMLRPDPEALRRGEYRTLYRHKVRLRREGEYRFVFTPECTVRGVRCVGLVFENR